MLENISDDFPAYPKRGAYLDSATMGLQPRSSIEAQNEFIQNTNNTVRKGLHKRSRKTADMYAHSKEMFSKYFGGSQENYAWIPNADYGWNIALHSILEKSEKQKPTFITSVYDHHAQLAPLIHLKKMDRINLQYLGLEEEYNLEESIDNLAQEDSIIALGHISPLFGLYRDIDSIVKCGKRCGSTTIIDFSRSAGQYEVNLDQNDIAILDASLDLLGPQGAGLLYIHQDVLPSLQNPLPGSGGVRFVIPDDYGQMRNIERFETGNPNITGLIGLAESLSYLKNIGKHEISLHRMELQNYLIKRIGELSSVNIVDPLMDSKMGNPNRSSILCFNVGDLSSHDVALLLDETLDVEVRSGMICTHPGLFSMGLEEVVQVSTHIYNTKQDIDLLIEGLEQVELMTA
ncbi:MAG: aminotransferase class V-fold PLP-dependent enzyme [Candidatus Kariarchaeaceae archaeon]|jgi:cysteine desulfurase/selenocysteine lyase